MLDILIFSSSIALGIICGIFLYRYISKEKHDKHNLLGNVKYELNNLYFEKAVALDALGKIKQYFDEKKIDEYERDRLSRKYINMLDNYNKRVFQLNPILEAQEIYEYKRQLESLLTEYTKRIDSKLASMTGYSEFKNKLQKGSANKIAKTEQAIGEHRRGSEVARDTALTTMSAYNPTVESPLVFENTDSQRSLVSRLKSSILKIRPRKFDEDKNEENSEKNKSLDKTTQDNKDASSMADKKSPEEKIISNSNSSSTTTTTTTSNTDNAPNDINNQTIYKIEHDLESISNEPRSKDSNKTEKVNVDVKEIDKIQSDILKTLKRLEES